jgi:starch synthase
VVDASELNIAAGSANGFVFDGMDAESLLDAIDRALGCYTRPDRWRTLQTTGMSQDFSWSRSAGEYLRLYERVVKDPVEHPDCRRQRLARDLAQAAN